MKIKYKLVSYDVWGNDEDGYEVNDAHFTGDIIELETGMTDEGIIDKLKEEGWVKETVKNDEIRIDGEEEYSLYFVYEPMEYPMFELRNEAV